MGRLAWRSNLVSSRDCCSSMGEQQWRELWTSSSRESSPPKNAKLAPKWLCTHFETCTKQQLHNTTAHNNTQHSKYIKQPVQNAPGQAHMQAWATTR
eukprot:12922508-Prorocentrum_lima.AAC.1